MAVRKGTRTRVPAKTASNPGRRNKKTPPWGVLFWLAFAIVLFGLYLINRQAINNSFLIIQREFFSRSVPEEQSPESPVGPGAIQVSPPSSAEQPPSEAASSQPSVATPSQTEPSTQTTQDTQQGTETAQSAAELRDRALHFIRVGSDGSVLRVRTDRRLPASESPLRDVIQALIAGPNAEERQRDLISLIPEGTRLLSIAIRGDTAYINFNEEFQYNIYGAEGYNGQLRQLVFTATEFSNVRDVQILIEGSRVDYIGESFWIGSPLSREMY